MANWPRPFWLPAARTEFRSRAFSFFLAGVLGLPAVQALAVAPPTPNLCVPSGQGYLRARLRGAIDADLAWVAPQPQCRGALRPGGNGIRLLFKGRAPSGEALTIVLGAGPLVAGQSARQVPVNLTVVRDGKGEFFATRGDDKCTFDELRQTALDSARGLYRIEARGYCTQPARALTGDAVLLLSRFDLQAVVDYRSTDATPTAPAPRDRDATST